MTFYRFPNPRVLTAWTERTPPGFTFSLKANRLITHKKRLKNVGSDVRTFDYLADRLGEKRGCLLYQLPPSLTFDPELLESFLAVLSPSHRNAVEFRHPSWYVEETYDLMRRHRVAFCTVSSTRVPDLVVETAPFGYFRFHGLTGGCRYTYQDEELRRWAEIIRSSAFEEVYVYFNNDYRAHAVFNGLRLAELLEAGRGEA